MAFLRDQLVLEDCGSVSGTASPSNHSHYGGQVGDSSSKGVDGRTSTQSKPRAVNLKRIVQRLDCKMVVLDQQMRQQDRQIEAQIK